jgi:hypothetical protein
VLRASEGCFFHSLANVNNATMNSQDAPLQTNGLRKCGIYAMEFYSANKKNEILSFTSK